MFGDYRIPNIDVLCDKLLLGIEHRGRDATGYGWIADDGSSYVQKACLPAKDFVKHRTAIPTDARTVLLHTRLATNGHPAFPENNHPTICGPVMSIHNGVIWNADKLFADIATPRMGTVDSEIVPALVNKFGIENNDVWVEDIDGSFALAFAEQNHPEDLVLVRGYSSPLYVYQTDKLIIWASTTNTIRDAWAAAFGTPPAFKNIASIKEGRVLYFNAKGYDETRSCAFTVQTWASRNTKNKGTGVTQIPATTGTNPVNHVDDPNDYRYDGELGYWVQRCSICDEWHGYDELAYDEGLWLCDDCDRALYAGMHNAASALARAALRDEPEVIDGTYTTCGEDDGDVCAIAERIVEAVNVPK